MAEIEESWQEDEFTRIFNTITKQGSREIICTWRVTKPLQTVPTLVFKWITIRYKEQTRNDFTNAFKYVPDSHKRAARRYAAQMWDRKRWNFGIEIKIYDHP